MAHIAKVLTSTTVSAIEESNSSEENSFAEEFSGQLASNIAGETFQNRLQKAAGQSSVVRKAARDLNTSKAGRLYMKGNQKLGEQIGKAGKAVRETKVVSDVMKGVEKIQGKTATKVTEKAAEKAVEKAAAKAVGKTAAKASGKCLLKKIPFVSAFAGAYFAFDRIKNKDYAGAVGELASGVAGCFPGVGTGLSVAIDASLLGKDIASAVKGSDDAKAVGAVGELAAVAAVGAPVAGTGIGAALAAVKEGGAAKSAEVGRVAKSVALKTAESKEQPKQDQQHKDSFLSKLMNVQHTPEDHTARRSATYVAPVVPDRPVPGAVQPPVHTAVIRQRQGGR